MPWLALSCGYSEVCRRIEGWAGNVRKWFDVKLWRMALLGVGGYCTGRRVVEDVL